MNELYKFDEANYQNIQKRTTRIAIRGIIFIDDHLVMIQSKKYQEYKFPGGGLEKGEKHIDTLKREVLEETGYHIKLDSIKELGFITEIRKSNQDDDEVFEMFSYYYYCSVDL